MVEETALENLRYPKDVRINALYLIPGDGVAIDILELFTEMNIYEDIFANTLSGDIVITDSRNLLGNAPIIGNEYIFLSYYTPGESQNQRDPITVIFNIHKVSKRKIHNERKQTYALHLVSEELIRNETKKISKSFEGTVSDIVQEIFQDSNDGLGSAKNLTVGDRTRNFIQFIAPRWSPLQTINWLAQQAVSTEHDVPNYLFYETVDGFHFTSLSELIFKGQFEGLKAAFTFQPNRHNKTTGGNPREPQTSLDYRTIEWFAIKNSMDVMTHLQRGMYSSRLELFDLTDKRIVNLELEYPDQYDKPSTRLDFLYNGALAGKQGDDLLPTRLQATTKDRELLLNKAPFSNLTVRPWYSKLYDPAIEDVKHYGEWIQQRKMEMEQYNSITLEMMVPGDSALRVGDFIQVDIPSTEPQPDEEFIYDPLLSGSYIITSLRHRFEGPDKHEMVLEITKDSYFKDLNKRS